MQPSEQPAGSVRAAGDLRKYRGDLLAEARDQGFGGRDQIPLAAVPIGLEPALIVVFIEVVEESQAFRGKAGASHG